MSAKRQRQLLVWLLLTVLLASLGMALVLEQWPLRQGPPEATTAATESHAIPWLWISRSATRWMR